LPADEDSHQRHERPELKVNLPWLGPVTIEEPAGPAFLDPEADRPRESIQNNHVSTAPTTTEHRRLRLRRLIAAAAALTIADRRMRASD